MREAIANALDSSLEWDDAHEKAIDKLTAFAYSDRLGTLLWRVKYFNCQQSYKPALLILAKRLKPINREIAYKVAQQAMNEWLFSFCKTCLGAKEVKAGELVVSCKACCGTGVRRYTDQERQQAIGAHMPKQIKAIHDIIGETDRKVSKNIRNKLQR